MAGSHISDACKEAVVLALTKDCNVEFQFNDIDLVATPSGNPSALVQSYHNECERRHAERIASPEYKAEQKEYARKKKEHNAKLASALSKAPRRMTLADADAWQKTCEANKDSYGGAIIAYAETWARLMEARMKKGERLPDIAKECSHLADNSGITGFMYGCAVGILAQVWIHGEALRLWHNLKTQLRDEGERANDNGEVLNPAILTTN